MHRDGLVLAAPSHPAPLCIPVFHSDTVPCWPSPPGATADLAREMLKYEKARFAAWCSTVDTAVTAGLQQPLLARQAAQPPDGIGLTATEASAAAAAGQKQPALGPPVAHSRAVINFPSALLRLVREAKYHDQLGLAVPPLAVNLALQEGQIRYAGAAAARLAYQSMGRQAVD